MPISITIELSPQLFNQLRRAKADQPHLKSIEELAIACLEDAMDEREEHLRQIASQAFSDLP